MINCLDIIKNKIQIEKLKRYERNDDIIESLKHLELPIIEDLPETYYDEDNEDNIYEDDLVIFATPNRDDMSYLQFYVFNEEDDEFLLHHDVYVFSSINDAKYMCVQNNHYIALATFEKDIMLYDCCVANPMTPQLLLRGHKSSVMSISTSERGIFSGGDDMSIIEWDLERLTPKNILEVGIQVEKLVLSNDDVIFTNKDTLYMTNTEKSLKLEGCVENILPYENQSIISTSSGHIYVFDSRNPDSFVFDKKMHNNPITGLDILKDKMGYCTFDGNVRIVDLSTFETEFSHEINSKLFSVKLSENNVIFYGDDSDALSFKKIKPAIFD